MKFREVDTRLYKVPHFETFCFETGVFKMRFTVASELCAKVCATMMIPDQNILSEPTISGRNETLYLLNHYGQSFYTAVSAMFFPLFLGKKKIDV